MSLYNQILLDAARSEKNRGTLAEAPITAVNPTCGDAVSLYLQIENAKISKAVFQGTGCAVSMASASLMIDCIKGLSLAEATSRAEMFLRMIQGEELSPEELHDLGSAAILQAVSKNPARVNCAGFVWRGLLKFLNDQVKL